MVWLVIKNLPEELHRKLKERAARYHRSMTKEVIAQLEKALATPGDQPEYRSPPEPLKVGFKPDDEWVYRAIREGRE